MTSVSVVSKVPVASQGAEAAKATSAVPAKKASPEAVSTKSGKVTASKVAGGKVAVILVRGQVGVMQTIKDTLQMLRLSRKNTCVVLDMSPIVRGMLHKVKDYVTWGDVDADTLKMLVEKRGVVHGGRVQDSKKLYTYKTQEFAGKQYVAAFHLNPPRKGFGRKGIKMPFNKGGGLGPRGEKINDLIVRMV